MKNIEYMKRELERLDVKVELLTGVSIMSVFDPELEETVCYATVDNREKLYVYIPCNAVCVCKFNNLLSIEQLNREISADTKKSIKKLAAEYAVARKVYITTFKACEPALQQYNAAIDNYRLTEPYYKVERLAHSLKKEFDCMVRQAYTVNTLGE